MALAIEELSLDGVVGTPLAQRHTRFCMTAVGVATLDHEVLDDTVEEQRVVELLIDEFQEVVAMTGCIVIERHENVSLGGLNHHLMALRHHRNGGGKRQRQNQESQLFHFSLAVTTVTI